MKKLMILFVMMFVTLGLSAQITSSHEAASRNLSKSATYYEFTGSWVVGGVTQDTLYWELFTNKDEPTNVNARVELTRKGTTDTYDIDLQGKLFENSTYAAIVESASNTATKELTDTTRYAGINQTALPATYYRYYRVVVNDDNDCAATDSITITKVAFKVFPR